MIESGAVSVIAAFIYDKLKDKNSSKIIHKAFDETIIYFKDRCVILETDLIKLFSEPKKDCEELSLLRNEDGSFEINSLVKKYLSLSSFHMPNEKEKIEFAKEIIYFLCKRTEALLFEDDKYGRKILSHYLNIYSNKSNKDHDELKKTTKYTKKGVEALLRRTPPVIKDKKYLSSIVSGDVLTIGREKELKDIHEQLRDNNRLLIVNGVGGIGKTTIARKYLNDYSKDYDHIIWIQASTGIIQSVFEDKVLLDNLQINKDNPDINAVFKEMVNKLNNLPGTNLFIIDDAQGDLNKTKDILPSTGNWKILVASRRHFDDIPDYEIKFLSKESAFQLFYNYYKGEKDDKILGEILSPVEYHTLVIEIFAKHASELNYSLITLKTKILESGFDLNTRINTNHAEESIKHILTYMNSVFPLSDLPKKDLYTLRIFALFPSKFIDISDIFELFNMKYEDQDDFMLESLNHLVEMGWLAKEQSFYKLHQVIKELILETFPPDFKYYENYLKTVIKLLNVVQSKDNPIDKFKWVPFGEIIVELFDVENVLVSGLFNNLALVYKDLGRYQKAAELLEKALKSNIKNFGEYHPTVAVRQSNLATVYRDLGRYPEAAELLEKALSSDIKNFGEYHPTVAVRQSNLALVYKDLGRYQEAANLLESTLEFNKKNYELNHPYIARAQSNLATVYQDLGRYQKAANLLESTLELNKKNYELNHPYIAQTQSNLATVYRDLGRYQEAAELLEKALSSDIKNFGEYHPRVATRQSNLATVYKDLGRYQESAELLEKALKSNIKNFGPDRPSVVISQSNLALVYKDLGRYQKAAELLEKALKSAIKNFGEYHPSVSISQSNLATVYQDLGRYQEAKELFIKALKTFETVLGPDHHNTKIIRDNFDNLNKVMKDKSHT